MPMTLYFKRAKNFVQNDDAGTKKFLAQPGPNPIPVPFWVATTRTFLDGIKDKSIVNLTPPDQMPGYKHPPKPVVEEEVVDEVDLVAAANAADAADATAEQLNVPQAPFGGQPMTPVPPAAKVGKVRASTLR